MNKTLIVLAGLAVANVASATLFFNAATTANNAAVRADFLAAAGVAQGQYLQDFESYAINADLQNAVVDGGLMFTNTGSGVLQARGAGAFGGSSPYGERGMWHNESAWLVLDFSANNALYVGGFDIDQGGATVRVTYSDASTQNFSLETTGSGGQSGEFWGLVAENGLNIAKVEFDASGDGGWGLDNIEYGVVPEPMTMTLLGLGAAALLRRKKN